MAGIPARSNHDIFLECFWHHVCLSHGVSRYQEVHKGDAKKGLHHGLSSGERLAAGKSSSVEASGLQFQILVDNFAARLFEALPQNFRTMPAQIDLNSRESFSKLYSRSNIMLMSSNLPEDLDETARDYLDVAKDANLKGLYVAIICDYVKAASQNHGSCEICQRHRFKLTEHHLVPRVMHGRLLKQGSCGKHQLKQVAWLCRGCHEFIHHRIKPHVLAQKYPSVELLLRRPDVREWAKSFRKVVRKVG